MEIVLPSAWSLDPGLSGLHQARCRERGLPREHGVPLRRRNAAFTEESVGCITEGRPLTPALSPSDGEREHGWPPHTVGQPDDRVVCGRPGSTESGCFGGLDAALLGCGLRPAPLIQRARPKPTCAPRCAGGPSTGRGWHARRCRSCATGFPGSARRPRSTR